MNWILIITSIVTAVAVLIYTVFAGLQWRAIKKQGDYAFEQVGKMQGQLDAIKEQAAIMRAQSEHAHGQLEATKEAVEMAKGQLVAMQHQEQAQFSQLEESRKLVAQNERAVKAAEDGVKIAQENTVHAQRAYVCVTKASIQEGNLFSLHIENAGNTPANDTQIVCRAEVLGKDPDPKLAAYFPEHHYSVLGVIAPRAHVQKLKAIDGGYGGEEQRKMQAGWKLYCYGKIYYNDVFGNLRNTYFSFSQRWNTPMVGPSREGNEAD